MNKNEKINIQDRIDQINQSINELQKEKAALNLVVKNGISFVSSDLDYVLEYLIFQKEKKVSIQHLKHSKNLTFEHLLIKYNISSEEWPGKINSSGFNKYYIVEFISFIADMQIKIGRSLTSEELFRAADYFVGNVDHMYLETAEPNEEEIKRN